MTGVSKKNIGLGLMAVLAVAIAAGSLRYLLPVIPGGAPNVMENPFALPWLRFHAGLAIVALAIGPFQFWTDKLGRRRKQHRWIGRVYVACCLASAPFGLLLAIGTSAGTYASIGFGCLAVLWFSTTAIAYKAARDRRFDAHRRWMIRSYALTFAAVTLRLYLPIAPLTGFDFMEGYRIIAWACWVPNLIVAEVLVRRIRGAVVV